MHYMSHSKLSKLSQSQNTHVKCIMSKQFSFCAVCMLTDYSEKNVMTELEGGDAAHTPLPSGVGQ